MAGPEDLEARVTTLEQELARLRTRVFETASDAAAARILAGGADRDVAEIRAEIRDSGRAHTQALNALRETQREYGEALREMQRSQGAMLRSQREMRETLLDHGLRISGLDGRMDSLDGRMDSLDGRMDSLDGRMDSLDGRMDSLDGRMDSLDGRVESLETEMRGGFAEMRTGMAQIVVLLGGTPPSA